MKAAIILKWNLTIAVFSFAFSVAAGEIRITFMENQRVLDETCEWLQTTGFTRDTIQRFRRLVEWQNSGGNGVRTNAFPPARDGWFVFTGVGDLTNRLESPFARVHAKPTLVCFDLTGFLMHDAGCRADRVLEDFDLKGIIGITSERVVGPESKEVFVGGRNRLSWPENYAALVGKKRSDTETSLGLSLRAGRPLPLATTNDDEGLKTLFARHVSDLKRDGFSFPTNFSIGMVFYVDFKRRFLLADHAFLCTARAGHFLTIEKAGPQGPYVHGDFVSESDLAATESLAEREDTNNPSDVDYGSTVIVSLNDRLIGIYRPESKR